MGASLTRFAWLSVCAAVVTIVLKAGAYLLTGSVGLLSDAMESVVNLVAALVALFALRLAARPADDSHHWGHGKAEYFSAGVEGVMIFVAAAVVIASAVHRLLHPAQLQQLGVGLLVSAVATVVNLVVARVLVNAGRTHRSITLTADGRHLMTDVWTSVGVIAGVGLVAVLHWQVLDPLVAIGVGVNILFTGATLIRSSSAGLMDASLPQTDLEVLDGVLNRHRCDGEIDFHAVRTRASGRHRFVTFHLLVPGAWSVHRAHDLAETIENEVAGALPGATVTSHLEPIEDESSYADIALGPERSGETG